MNLYFLRHGEAVDPVKYSDDERPLSENGRRQAAAVSRFFTQRELAIDCIFCSPLVRARQTAEAVQLALPSTLLETNSNLLSSSDPLAILLDLRVSKAENVLLVGHEPHLSKTISLLLGVQDRSRVDMKPCSLALITTASTPDPGRGMLQWLLPVSEMMRQAAGN